MSILIFLICSGICVFSSCHVGGKNTSKKCLGMFVLVGPFCFNLLILLSGMKCKTAQLSGENKSRHFLIVVYLFIPIVNVSVIE